LKKKKSGSSTYSAALAGLDSDSKEPMIYDNYNKTMRKDCQTLNTEHSVHRRPLVVLPTTKSTSSPCKPTTKTSEKRTSPGTLEKSSQQTFLSTTSSAQDSRAKVSAWLERGSALMTHEARSFMKSLGLPSITDQAHYSLKMLNDCYRTITGSPLRLFSPQWMSWGTMRSGRCSTARIGAFRRTGSECSLSDILEDKVDSKYFLSGVQVDKILKLNDSSTKEDGKRGTSLSDECMERVGFAHHYQQEQEEDTCQR